MLELNRTVKKIFESKKRYRKTLAQLPIEKKMTIFLRLQKNVYSILKLRGLGKKPWMMSEFSPMRDKKQTYFKNMTSFEIKIPCDKNWINFFDVMDNHRCGFFYDVRTNSANSHVYEFRGAS